jgi:hypothetical protein
VDRVRRFAKIPGKCTGVDLVIVDIPDDLLILELSSPPSFVPEWIKRKKGFLEVLFDFANSNLHDNGAILLFFSNDLDVKADLKGLMSAYRFLTFKEWMGVNRLCMTSARDYLKTVTLPQPSFIICIIMSLVNAYIC